MDEKVLKTLIKKASGYTANEVSEEYQKTADGKMELVKKKVTKKYYPPDNSALKSYLEIAGKTESEFTAMTDEELDAEKKRLLAELAGK